jgi:hypothetical protein
MLGETEKKDLKDEFAGARAIQNRFRSPVKPVPRKS